MTKNISKLYYKDYFKGIGWGYLLLETNAAKDIIAKNKKLFEETKNIELLEAKFHEIPKLDIANKEFELELEVAYPGLITGAGIGHESKIEGEFKLGMHFNYTYGMPVVYGSSVKGVLKSYFPHNKDKEDLQKSKTDHLNSYLSESGISLNLNSEAMMMLGRNIFEGSALVKEKEVKQSIYKRDIFFDAIISKTSNNFLEKDAITPHGDNPLKDPIPITFMKIASGVVMRFNFSLHDFEIDGKVVVTAKTKRLLFKSLLCDFGIGAKTNVGYGQFKKH